MKKIFLVLFVTAIYSVFKFWQMPITQLKYKFNLCFIKDTPGATESFVTYTPYKCSDEKRTPIAASLDGPWAELSDLVIINVKSFEVTVESNRPFLDATCIPGKKSVLKYEILQNGEDKFDLLSEIEIPVPC